jgi:hypothetical protein
MMWRSPGFTFEMETAAESRPPRRGLPCPARPGTLVDHFQIHRLDLSPRPRCLPQKSQAGRDARVVGEAADGQALTHRFPTELRLQLLHHALEGDAVQRVAGLIVRCHRWRFRLGCGLGPSAAAWKIRAGRCTDLP